MPVCLKGHRFGRLGFRWRPTGRCGWRGRFFGFQVAGVAGGLGFSGGVSRFDCACLYEGEGVVASVDADVGEPPPQRSTASAP